VLKLKFNTSSEQNTNCNFNMAQHMSRGDYYHSGVNRRHRMQGGATPLERGIADHLREIYPTPHMTKYDEYGKETTGYKLNRLENLVVHDPNTTSISNNPNYPEFKVVMPILRDALANPQKYGIADKDGRGYVQLDNDWGNSMVRDAKQVLREDEGYDNELLRTFRGENPFPVQPQIAQGPPAPDNTPEVNPGHPNAGQSIQQRMDAIKAEMRTEGLVGNALEPEQQRTINLIIEKQLTDEANLQSIAIPEGIAHNNANLLRHIQAEKRRRGFQGP
jgi:hypothetical protein